jgi:hypothetical protein
MHVPPAMDKTEAFADLLWTHHSVFLLEFVEWLADSEV